MTTLLIDGDILAYQAASIGQKSFKWDEDSTSTWVADIEEIIPKMDEQLDRWMVKLKGDDLIVCLSCASVDGWRKQVLPSYKAHRNPAAVPVLREPLKDYLRENYRFKERPTLEADDVMGILSTHPTLIPGKKIVVSIDKDMKSFPGWLYNPDKDTKAQYIPEEEADYWHLYQTLTGDATDGYKGCPGIGPKKAEAVLTNSPTPWSSVVNAYVQKGLTEEDALVQARVARICRYTDYDFRKKEVKLWTPASIC